jgi:TRAP-type transport system periplasmic protein
MRLGRRFAGALLALCAIGVGSVLAGCGSSSSTKTLTLGYVTTPTHPYGLALAQYAAQVDSASGGKLKIKLLPTYGGGNDAKLLADEIGGTVNMGSVSAAVWDTKQVYSFEALQMPFLITSYAPEGKVLGSSLQQQMLAGTEAVGLHGLAIHEGGLRKPLSTGACFTTTASYNGVPFRVPPGQLLKDGIAALGASPTPLPLSDVYLAFKQGTVKGMEANYGLVLTNKYYEVAKCMTGNVNFWPFPTVLSINNNTWKGLTSAEQGWLATPAAKLPAESLAILTNPASKTVPTLCTNGLKIGKATAADISALVAKETPVYTSYESRSPSTTGTFVPQIQQMKAAMPPPAPAAPLPAGCAAP